jgi:hypothetical protein
MERTQFTFYDSFFRSISRIKNKAARCDAYDAICRYALTGEEPDYDNMADIAAIAFEGAKPNLDASRRKAESGKKGGENKQPASKAEANGEQSETKNKDKNKDKKKNKNKDKCLKGDFEKFWNAYPRKEGKQKAEAAFAKVDVSVDALISALETQKRSSQWTKDGGQFIPHASTWLNGKRWEDQLGAEAPKAGRSLDADEQAAIDRLLGGDL